MVSPQAIITAFSLIIIEIVTGFVIGTIPPPIDVTTIPPIQNDPRLAVAAKTGQTWLELADEINNSFFVTRGILQLFFLFGAPALTIVALVRSE